MEQWKEYKLGDISNMKYGKLPPKQNNGSYPIWSGYRNVGFATTYNCRKGTIIVVARGVGGTGDVKISSEDCFLTNLSIAVELDNKICEPLYFYYKYKLSNLRYLDTGSAQSQITIDDLKRLSLKLPPLEEQKRITEILSSIDYKIELNRRINDNLEQQAQALFKSWFVDFEPFKDGEFVDSWYVFTILIAYFYGSFFIRLLQRTSSFHKMFLLGSFLLISSTNNSLATDSIALSVLTLCCYCLPPMKIS